MRRLRYLTADESSTSTNSTDEENFGIANVGSAADGMKLMLLEMGFSPEELFLGNLLAVVVGALAICALHILFNRHLVRKADAKRQKKYEAALKNGEKNVKKPEPYTLPKMLEFPRAELGFGTVAALGFFKSSLGVLNDAAALGWVRVVAAFALACIVLPCIYALGMLFYLRSQIQFIEYGSGRIQLPIVGRIAAAVKTALTYCCAPCVTSYTEFVLKRKANQYRVSPLDHAASEKEKVERNDAATKIQSIYRRHQVG
jgi:hypothetical protein